MPGTAPPSTQSPVTRWPPHERPALMSDPITHNPELHHLFFLIEHTTDRENNEDQAETAATIRLACPLNAKNAPLGT